MSKPLKIKVTDIADMVVFSSLVQDGILRLRDLKFLKDENRFVGVLNRVRWEALSSEEREELKSKGLTAAQDDLENGGGDAAFEDVDTDGGNALQRQHLGFTFEQVSWVAHKNLPDDKDTFMTLLAVKATEEATVMTFAEGRAIRIAHRKIALFAEDLGEAWPSFYLPDHESDLGQ